MLVWGAGGHGRVVADTARAAGLEVVGFIDRDRDKCGEIVEPGGGRVIVTEETFLALIADRATLPVNANCIALGLGDNAARLRAADLAADWMSDPLVHPDCSISPHSSLGQGTVLFPKSVVNSAAAIGRAVIVNSGAIVEHDCVLGDASHVSPGAVLGGGVSVGRLAWICAGAVVLPGVRIGERAIVGAGAVVLHDVPEAATVVGNPARMIKKRS